MTTKSEHVASLQKRADKAAAAFSHKALKRKRIIACVFVLGIILSVGIGAITTNRERKLAYQNYLSDSNAIDFESMNYKDTFQLWNENDLGNDVNVLLSGGKVYARRDLVIAPKDGKYAVVRGNEQLKLIDKDISYINVVGDTIIYRDNSTRNIYSYNMSDGEMQEICNDNCGEVFITNQKIYYVSFSDTSAIAQINLDGSEKEIVVDVPINSFVVCGDRIVYLTNAQELCEYSHSDGLSTTIMSNVERFFINGGFVIESGSRIFTCHTNGHNAKMLYESHAPSMALVGASSDEVFYQERGKLYAVTATTTLELSSTVYNYYSSVVQYQGSYYATAHKDDENVVATVELLNLTVQ